MAFGTRYGFALAVAVTLGFSASVAALQEPVPREPPATGRALPDFDVRASRRPAAPSPAALAAYRGAREQRGDRGARVHPHTGALRVVENPPAVLTARTTEVSARAVVESLAGGMGLDGSDVTELRMVRDYMSGSTGLRTIAFAQSIDGIPVFDGVVTLHAAADGSIVRVTSSAGRRAGRQFRPGGRRDAGASAAWFPIDGVLRLAWHTVVESQDPKAVYDVLADAETGDLLFRRNRVRHAEGTGRVAQSADTLLRDPRLPDPMPVGAAGPGGCPPPVNHLVRSLNAPFRDAPSVLGDTGHLAGNNTHVYRRAAPSEGAAGTFDGTAWSFDFPFGSAGAAETAMFFSMNFVHDFFYDLGFDEAAGNFQAANFGRGGAAGDPMLALARAAGRNNAYYQHAPDGTSPTIAMFLWDGSGCWSQDVDGDGTPDLDGDHDSDIIIHEFHHGVSLRLNTAWAGDEAAAIGEGGGDFFAYSVNGDTVLADYARQGGLRSINAKTYADWSCPLWFLCEEHTNGEIWANALWDVRERFRADLVRGSEGAAVNESHQLYVDALKLSPPAPTMLDMRDALLLADSLRNPGAPRSQNFCRIWEPFAARGMGIDATDTADNGLNKVVAAFNVPDGCQAPPAPPTIALTVVAPTATEAGPASGFLRISRGSAQPAALTVNYAISGSAANGTDYATLSGTVTIASDAVAADVEVAPVDDTVLESNETVVLSLRAHASYIVGTPASGTVTIVSDDVAPDFVVTAFTASKKAAAGGTAVMTDTTKNQGVAASPVSTTSYYLSTNSLLDASDPLLGGREVPELAPGALHTGSAAVMLPDALEPGTFVVIAKADGPDAIVEPNETNNRRTTTIQIGPDLTVSTLSAPAAAAAGATILVSETTKNDGAGTAAASLTRFYLSANGTLDASDAALAERNVQALDAGAVSAASTSVAIPPSTTAGVYYVFAQADGNGSLAEAVETNNTRAVLLRVGADLTVTSASVPAVAASGGTLVLTDTTTNGGAGPAPPSTTAWYWSSNSLLDTSDVRLSTGRTVAELASGTSSTGTTTVTLPDAAPGTWYLIAKADDGLIVPETSETNNTRVSGVKIGPDLTISSMAVPSTALSGTAILVTHTAKNTGGGDAGACVITFYLSPNSTLDASDTDLGTVGGVQALAGGASVTGSTTLTIPQGLSGTFYLIALVDGTQVVMETSEANNTKARSIRITVPTGAP